MGHKLALNDIRALIKNLDSLTLDHIIKCKKNRDNATLETVASRIVPGTFLVDSANSANVENGVDDAESDFSGFSDRSVVLEADSEAEEAEKGAASTTLDSRRTWQMAFGSEGSGEDSHEPKKPRFHNSSGNVDINQDGINDPIGNKDRDRHAYKKIQAESLSPPQLADGDLFGDELSDFALQAARSSPSQLDHEDVDYAEEDNDAETDKDTDEEDKELGSRKLVSMAAVRVVPYPRLGQGDMRIDGQIVRMHDYFGEDLSDLIKQYHRREAAPSIPGQHLALDPHQQHAVTTISKMCDGPFKGAILGDGMGLGKTLSTIGVLGHRKNKAVGAFDLIICHKSLIPQWLAEIERFYRLQARQRVLVLSGKVKLGATDLLDIGYDVILCTYQYLEYQYRRRMKYEAWCKAYRKEGLFSANKAVERRFRKRPTLSLFSYLYLDGRDKYIRHLVLDEAQYAKNHTGKTHLAIKALKYNHIIMLSGTFFANRWHDIFGLIDFLKGHPFPQPSLFGRCFSSSNGSEMWQDPRPDQALRLRKFLMSQVLARPNEALKLPPLREEIGATFSLDDETADEIAVCLRTFTLRLRGTIPSADVVPSIIVPGTSDTLQEAMVLALRGQQKAAHPFLSMAITNFGRLVEPPKKYWQENLEAKARKDLAKYKEATSRAKGLRFGLHIEVDSLWWATHGGNEECDNLLDSSSQVASDRSSSPGSTDEESEVDEDDSASQDGALSQERTEGKNPCDALKTAVIDVENGERILDKQEPLAKQLWRKFLFSSPAADLHSPRVDAFFKLWLRIQQRHPGAKVIVFSQFLQFLDILAQVFMNEYRTKCFRYDGSLEQVRRPQELDHFIKCDDPSRPLLLTDKAGGVGLNIAAASIVVQVEPWWNAAVEQQAWMRVYRRGQRKEVWIYKIMCDNSVMEEWIIKRRDEKHATNLTLYDGVRRLDEDMLAIPAITKHY